MPTIDADTHVIESELTWSFFDPAMEKFRPYLVRARDARTGVERNRWVIDGNLVPRQEGPGGQFLATPPLPENLARVSEELPWEWRSLADPIGRATDATKHGFDMQVIFPTLFIAYLTDDVNLEVALARSYNRFLADACKKTNGAANWVVVPPLRDRSCVVEEMEFGKDNGAVGVLFRGLEADRSLADPYFFPVYEQAMRLDLPICIHTGPGSPTLTKMMDTRYTKTFGHNRMPPIIAFHDLIACKVPEQFPGLRWAFLEATASWIPFMMHFHRRVARQRGEDLDFYGPELFEAYNIFIACEADEDIPYLARSIGWSHLLTGSDYGHADQSAELDLVDHLRERGDISASQLAMIVEANPSLVYGIK